MSNKNNPLMESFVKNMLEILLDSNESALFGKNDVGGAKTVVANSYYTDDNVLSKVSNNQTLREKLGSAKLINNLIDDLNSNLGEEIDLQFVSKKLKYINKFEKNFFTNVSLGSSLKYILEIIKKIVTKYNSLSFKNEKEKTDFENLFPILFKFYERIISNIQINDSNRNNFIQLYQNVKAGFTNNTYRNGKNFFRFYHLYLKNPKENVININDVENTIAQYLNSNNTAKDIFESIETTLSIEDFFKKKAIYKQNLLNRAKSQKDFFDVFNTYFSDNERNTLFESWVQNQSSHAKEVIINNLKSIPDNLSLANKVIARANSLNNNLNEKKSFLDLLFSLNLTKEKILSTDYTNQVAGLIFNTNINLHNFGITQLQEHREYIDTKSLKPKAETFMNSILGNPNSYHKQIQNIINSRLGITTTFVDKFIVSNRAYINAIIQYLISSGNLEYYLALSSKLNKSTIDTVNNGFINGINKHQKYYEIVNHIKDNYFESLADNTKSKIETLIDK